MTGGDRLELVAYDTLKAARLPSSFDPADPNAEFAYVMEDLDIDLVKITSVSFQIRGDNNNFIDELRIGSTYGSVIPEPRSGVLFAFGACVIAGVASSGLRRRASWI
jgi:hypothetical protein